MSNVEATAERLRKNVETELERLEGEELMSNEERSRALRACTLTLREIGKLTGDSLEITDAKFMRLPNFRRVYGVIEKALEPYPEAMRAVADALADKGIGSAPKEGQ